MRKSPTNKKKSVGKSPTNKKKSVRKSPTNKKQSLGKSPTNKKQSVRKSPTNKKQSGRKSHRRIKNDGGGFFSDLYHLLFGGRNRVHPGDVVVQVESVKSNYDATTSGRDATISSDAPNK